jgi:sortase A
MQKWLPALSRALLITGGLLILGGLAWGIWTRVNAPPAPVITEAGAVVLAETAPPQPATPTATNSPPPSPTPTLQPSPTQAAEGPTPALLPEWTVTAPAPEPTPTSPPTPLPPTPTPSPTATRPPQAEKPPSRIVAPSIGLDASVVPMGWEMIDRDGAMTTEWIVPRDAAGWHLNSALPGHGENVVLSGHHNIEGKVFRYVVDLSLGDEVTLYVDDVPYVYTVTDKYILKEAGMPLRVRQKNAQWIMPAGEERLTLVTCWPYEWPGNSHRVIVVARPPGDISPKDVGVE